MRSPARALGLLLLLACLTPVRAWGSWQTLRAGVDGLPGDQVFAIAQGRDGSIAFGTQLGLGIFDGDRWTAYTSQLPNRIVHAVLQDRHGAWWVGTQQGGLARFDGVTWTTIDAASGDLPSNQIQSLLEDHSGDLWVGTASGLVRRRAATGVWERIPNSQLVNPQVNALLEDRRHRLWLATPEGASMADTTRTQWTSYLKDPLALAQDSLFSVAEDRDGGIWFGSSSGAVRLDASGAWRYFPVGSGVPGGDLNAIVRDSTGGLWFAGGSGIARFDGRTFQAVPGPIPITGFYAVFSLLVDDPGNLWVGTAVLGAYRSDGTGLDAFIAPGGPCEAPTPSGAEVHSHELASNCLNDVLEDHFGERWVATAESGVARLDRAGTWSALRAAPGGLASDSVTALFEDRLGNLWLGTSTAGLSRLDSTRTTWTRFTHANGLPADSISTLFQDGAGVMWAGTPRGASRRNGSNWTPVLQSGFGGVPTPCLVLQMVEDAARTVWIRTAEGLWSVDASRLQVARHGLADGLPDDAVGAILRAADGTLWAGTPSGIAHRVDDAWVVWDAVAVPIGQTLTFYEDRSGRVWAGGEFGVAHFAGGAWTSYSVPTIGFNRIVQILQDARQRMWFAGSDGNLGYWNGVSWRSVDRLGGIAPGIVSRMIEDSQGRLWVIGQGGLTLVAPDRTGPQTVFRLPPARITTSRNLSFAFGAAYGETADLEFLPSWDGMPEPDWSTATDFSRSDVPDGIHMFSVRSRDWARNEDPSAASVTFEVDATPPQAVLSAPRFGAPVKGVVSIEGSTTDARYLLHRLEARALGSTTWASLGTFTSAVGQDTLTTWDTNSLPDGDYELKLSVQDSLGLVGTALVRVIVDNVAPFVDVTSPVLVRASTGGDVFTTNADVHVYVPPLALDADATVTLDQDAGTSVPATLPDGAARVGAAWAIRWTGGNLVHPGVLDLRAPAGETRPLAIYGEAVAGTWQYLGGAPVAAGAPLSVPLSAPGRYALFTGGTAAGTTGLGPISLAPRAFSPGGTFGSREVAIGFALGRPGNVDVTVFNRAGRMVRSVASGLSMPGGSGVVRWDGRDRDGHVVEEGLYIVTVEALGERQTRTLAVLR